MANIPPKKQIPQTPVDASGTAQAEAQRSTPSLTTPPASEAPLGPSAAQPEASAEQPNPALRMGTSADGAGNTAPVAGMAPIDSKEIKTMAQVIISESHDRWGKGGITLPLRVPPVPPSVHDMGKFSGVDLSSAEFVLEVAKKVVEFNQKIPVVKFVQTTKRVLFPPVEMADGGISLRLNDASGMGELRIPENTSVEVSFGYKVSIPTGWVGEVTVAGLVGQRVLCGILAGDGVAELKVRLQTNNPYLPVFRAGEEIAQLHLRQMQPCTVQISNPFDS